MTLKDFQKRCYQQAVDKGWAGPEHPVSIPEQVALICSEACEALESYRSGEPLSFISDKGKPEGVGIEYADAVIRIGHYMEALGLDLETEIIKKLDYNQTRPYRHGGKLV